MKINSSTRIDIQSHIGKRLKFKEGDIVQLMPINRLIDTYDNVHVTSSCGDAFELVTVLFGNKKFDVCLLDEYKSYENECFVVTGINTATVDNLTGGSCRIPRYTIQLIDEDISWSITLDVFDFMINYKENVLYKKILY